MESQCESKNIYDILNYSKFLNLLKKYYENRDISHGWDHVIKVTHNALILAKASNIINTTDLKIIVLAALGHDIWDHKYIKDDQIYNIKFLFDQDLLDLGILAMQRDLIIRIIDTISFSKEYKMRLNNEKFNFEVPEEKLRNIVSDADKLEALGINSIKRMIDYEINSNSHTVSIDQHIQHITNHCKEKLYLLIKENYIKTPYAIKLATPLLLEMQEIVDNKVNLNKFISKYLETP